MRLTLEKGKKGKKGSVDEEIVKLKRNAEISSRLIGTRIDNITKEKIERTRSIINLIMSNVEGKASEKNPQVASNTLVLKLQTKEKDLTSRLHALEDLAAKNSAEMKQLMAKYEMEKDINERLLWRIQRQENSTSSQGGDTAKNEKNSTAAVSTNANTTSGKGKNSDELQKQLEQLMKEKNNELNLLKKEMESIKQAYDARGDEIKNANKSLVELKNALRNLKNETTDEKAELLQLREAKSNYQRDLTKLSEALADEKRAIQNLRQDYDMKLRSLMTTPVLRFRKSAQAVRNIRSMQMI